MTVASRHGVVSGCVGRQDHDRSAVHQLDTDRSGRRAGRGNAVVGAGLADFAKLEDAVVPHALRHIAAVGLAWLGYAIALYLRRDSLFGAADLGSATLAASLVGALLLSVGGWLGGRLVYSFGAGVSK